jgi:hypothetical protein
MTFIVARLHTQKTEFPENAPCAPRHRSLVQRLLPAHQGRRQPSPEMLKELAVSSPNVKIARLAASTSPEIEDADAMVGVTSPRTLQARHETPVAAHHQRRVESHGQVGVFLNW